MIRIAIAVAACVLASPILGQNAVQWRVQDGGNGHWYWFNTNAQKWNAARSAAVALGGDLACLTTAAENNFARSILLPQEIAVGYMGAFRDASGWRWVSGEPWSFTNWNPGEPNGSSGEVAWLQNIPNYSNGWNDHPPEINVQGSIWEWSADCNNDGLVDYGQILIGELPDANGSLIPDCCETSIACEAPVFEWRSQDGGNGHWYSLLWEVRFWPDAAARVQELGGHLATITSEAERIAVLPLCDTVIGADVWLGASRANLSAPMQWVTGEPWGYAAWAPGAPHADPDALFLEVVGRAEEAEFGLWNATSFYAWGPGEISLVEFDADCNNDGIVDYGQIRAGELEDANANGVPDCCDAGTSCSPCQGDVTGNGTVDGIDLAAVLDAWGSSGKGEFATDTNGDGIVDAADLSAVLSGWGACPK